MGLIAWIIFGAFIGALASVIASRNEPVSIVLNIIVGITGAIGGGTLASMMGIGFDSGLSLSGLVVPTAGAVALIAIVNAFDQESHHYEK